MTDKDSMNEPGKARWFPSVFIGLTILIILFGLAFLISGREVIERPILIFFILLAWLGALGGIIVSRSED